MTKQICKKEYTLVSKKLAKGKKISIIVYK